MQQDWEISLVYPNPYPSKDRIKQRWYAHPAFPLILQLGGEILVRSNWKEYLQEFADSLIYAQEYLSKDESPNNYNYATPYVSDARQGPIERIEKSMAWTNFEKKYDECDERTYDLILS